MLTCQIITKNNATTIERAIDSLRSVDAEIVVADLGSEDVTKEICRRKMVSVIDCAGKTNGSEVRNRLVKIAKHDWQLALEPWEVVTDPTAIRACLGNPAAYNVRLLQRGILSYDVRLWHRSLGLSFKNPVYEYLDVADDKTSLCACLLYSDGGGRTTLEDIKAWKRESPTSFEPDYYEAFYHLGKNRWEEFLSCSTKYLFNRHKANKPTIMMKYYTGIVQCHVKKHAGNAIQQVVECLTVKPLMAELWCLLGDIYYHLVGNYRFARTYYENACFLGSRRLDGDLWPIEIAKYKEYPERMIKACREAEAIKPMAVKIKRT